MGGAAALPFASVIGMPLFCKQVTVVRIHPEAQP